MVITAPQVKMTNLNVLSAKTLIVLVYSVNNIMKNDFDWSFFLEEHSGNTFP